MKLACARENELAGQGNLAMRELAGIGLGRSDLGTGLSEFLHMGHLPEAESTYTILL